MNTDRNKQAKIPTLQIIDELKRFGYKSAIFQAALELRVWDKISIGNNTPESLSQKEHWDPTGTRMLLDALCSIGLLNNNNDIYSLVPEAEHSLLSDKPTYRGNSILTELMWEGNGQLAEAISKGERPIHKNLIQEKMTDHWVEDYANVWALAKHNTEQFDVLWKSLDIQSFDDLKILDVACGPGQKSLSIARLNPNVQVTLLDRTQMLHIAKEVAKALGIEKQVKFINGDLWLEDFGSDQYDVVWLGNITHFFSRKDNSRLFRKCYKSLKKNGIVVIDSVLRRDGDPSLLWVALWLYATSPNGDAYSFHDYKELLNSEGFVNIKN
ncbi:class I SAM-dependent methyltransferase, partial [Candidatus Neomarinimicrobiota bacterium]